jgi:hypothetical protein
VRKYLQILLLAVAATAAAEAQAQFRVRSNTPPPMERAAAVSLAINLRLDSALGEDRTQLREFLSHYPYVRVAEPADYELTGKRDFPLMLTMKNLREPENYWYRDFSKPLHFDRWPETFELGNLEQGDYRAPLDLALQKIERIRILLALDDGSARKIVRGCALLGPTTECHWGAFREVPGDQSPDDIDIGTLSGTRLANLGPTPRYLSAFWIDIKLGITRAIPATKPQVPTPSGSEISSAKLPAGDPVRGPAWLVTIASDRPIDTASIEQARFGEDKSPCPLASDATCAALSQLPADHSNWTVSVAEYRNLPMPMFGVGGGDDALQGMAAWMAELYSTAANFDRLKADDLKMARAQQEYAGQDSAEIAHRCGGTLIAPDLVVTAAHCVANKEDFDGKDILTVPRLRRVRLGTLELCDGCGSTYQIVSVAVHAGYNPHGTLNTDDIALLRITPDESTDSETLPSPIALGTAPIGQRDALLIYGWGFTHQSSAYRGNDAIDTNSQAQLVPKQLQFGSVQKDPKACSQEMQRKDIPASMVCVVGKTHNVFSCRGDSGGPLTRKQGRRREEIVGLTSWSYGCGDKFPSVYTDVTHYTRWISLAAKQLRSREGVIKVNAAGALVPAVSRATPARRSK